MSGKLTPVGKAWLIMFGITILIWSLIFYLILN